MDGLNISIARSVTKGNKTMFDVFEAADNELTDLINELKVLRKDIINLNTDIKYNYSDDIWRLRDLQALYDELHEKATRKAQAIRDNPYKKATGLGFLKVLEEM